MDRFQHGIRSTANLEMLYRKQFIKIHVLFSCGSLLPVFGVMVSVLVHL